MNKKTLASLAVSDEVLRQWIATRVQESEIDVVLQYSNKDDVAQIASNFTGSVGELADGRLIKIERPSAKDAAQIIITAEAPYRSTGIEPFNVAVLSTARVAEGMLSGDFGSHGYVEVMHVQELMQYSSTTGDRVKITLSSSDASDFEPGELYAVSMSSKAVSAAALDIGVPVCLVCKRDTDDVDVVVAGIALLSQELANLMANSWKADSETQPG